MFSSILKFAALSNNLQATVVAVALKSFVKVGSVNAKVCRDESAKRHTELALVGDD